jgi:hypothetical protein
VGGGVGGGVGGLVGGVVGGGVLDDAVIQHRTRVDGGSSPIVE